MDTLQIILLIAIAFSSYPIGRFIASKTQEELQAGAKWFKLIMLACAIGIIISLFLARENSMVLLIASFAFIFLLTLASLLYKKKKKRKSKKRKRKKSKIKKRKEKARKVK